MLGEIFDKTTEGIINWVKTFYQIFNDHNHDGLNSKKLSQESSVAYLGNNQTFSGVNTFSSFPVIPTISPTDNAHAISKGYYDSTAVKKADTSLSGVSWFLDEDDFASDSAVKAPSQQSVKAYINTLGVFDSGKVVRLTASDNLKTSADTERSNSEAFYTKVKEIAIKNLGTIRVKFDARTIGPNDDGYGHFRVYINGSAVGTERNQISDSIGPYDYTNYSQDFTITDSNLVDGQALIQLYMYTNITDYTAYVRNFRIYYDRDYDYDYEVNTD